MDHKSSRGTGTMNRELPTPHKDLGRTLSMGRFPYRRTGGPRMPASEMSSRAFARTSSSCRTPIVARIGAAVAEANAG